MSETIIPETTTFDVENSPKEFSLYNPDETRKGALILRAMNHKLRREILSRINHSGKSNVTDLYKTMQIEQSVASQHLAVLRNAKLVTTERTGKQIWYTVNHDRINHYQQKVKELLG